MKIAIVGAGIMGQLAALALAKAGCTISLFDKGGSNCSLAAAGMLCAITELEKSELEIYYLGLESLNKHWPSIISSLDLPVFYVKKGSLLIAHPQDKAEIERFVSIIAAKKPHAPIKKIGADEIKMLEPELTKFADAYFLPEEGQIDNQQLMKALTHQLKKEPIQWRDVSVKEVHPYKVILDHAVENFDAVIDCRGLGAKSLFKDLRGVRGELIWLHAPEVKFERPIRLLHPRYNLYVVPRPDDIYIIGASEIEVEDNSPISVRSSLELLSAAYYLHSGFSEARIINMVTHSRPTLSSHKPEIKFMPGLVAINGLYRHGFLIAPALAEELMHYLKSGISAVTYPSLWEEMNVIH